jgi:hypothetical protein
VVLFAHSHAAASTIYSYQFQGVITSVSHSEIALDGALSEGDVFLGTFSYSFDAEPNKANQNINERPRYATLGLAMNGLTMHAEPWFWLSSPEYLSIWRVNTGDAIRADPHVGEVVAWLNLVDGSLLPGLEPKQVTDGGFYLYVGCEACPWKESRVEGAITSFRVVPEPASGLVLASGTALVLTRYHRRRRHADARRSVHGASGTSPFVTHKKRATPLERINADAGSGIGVV